MERECSPPLPNCKTTDWDYPMRREMQEIIPGLFLGPFAVAMKSKLPLLKNEGITHIICVRQDLEANFIKPCFPEEFKYLVLNVRDSTTENIIRYIPEIKHFIDSSICDGGKVLVHGNAGISRSAALVIAYIMETYGVTYKQALDHVHKTRFCVSLNEGFVRQLLEYEPIYQAKSTLRNGQPSQRTGELKRKLDSDSDYLDNRDHMEGLR